MILHERQLRAAFEQHRSSVPEPCRIHYDTLLRISEQRLRELEAALGRRGQRADRGAARFVRAFGRLLGRITSRGGARRILSMDIDSVRRLEATYFEAFHDAPPRDIACMLMAFVGPLEQERAALVRKAQPLFARPPGSRA